MRTKPKPMFRGWDWTELFPVFGIEPNDKLDEEFLLHLLKLRIADAAAISLGITSGNNPEAKAKLNKVREYLRTLAKASHSTDGSVWAAIAELECDWALTCWVEQHIGGAWS